MINTSLHYTTQCYPSSKYHTTLFKVPHHHLQSTTSPSSKYNTTLFKVPHHPLKSTIPPSSKYHTTLFKVPYHPLQSTTSPSSKYHITLFKVPHHPHQSTIPNFQNFLSFSFTIRFCTNNQKPIKQINRQTMRTFILRSTNFCVTCRESKENQASEN